MQKRLALTFAGHSSASWVEYYTADPEMLEQDDFYSRDDLMDVSMMFDGIGALVGVHLIYQNYNFKQLAKNLAKKYDCSPHVVSFFGSNSSECATPEAKITAFLDDASGWSHVMLSVEGSAEGKKPDE